MSNVTDAELVAAYLAGDPSALAGIYDRYADALYDTAAAMTRRRHDAADVMQDVFVIAAERLGQLRDPSRLKPWLFAIMRNEVYRRSGKQRRTVVTDFTEPVAEMSLPPDHDDPTANAEFDELAAMVRGAAAGLDERDQLVLELSVRQGLQGDDLADALGVSTQQSYNLVHRMRQRTERSLAAYCVARQGRKDCPELAKILQGWDEQFTVLIRKRVARHIDGCDICERRRRTLAPFALFGGAPAFAAPAGLRDRVLGAAGQVSPAGGGSGAGGAATYAFGRPGGFPSAVKYVRRLALWIVGAIAGLLLVTGSTVYVLAEGGGSEPPSTTTTTAATTTVPIAAPPTLPAESSTTSSTTSTSTTSTSTSTTTTSTTSTTTTTTTTTTLPETTTTTTTTTAPAPGALALSAGSIDFGTTLSSAVVTLSNPGGTPVGWSSTMGPIGFQSGGSPFGYSPAAGTLQPGASVEVTFTIDRTWGTEGPLPTERVTFFAGDLAAAVDLVGEIARPPVIEPIREPAPQVCTRPGTSASQAAIAVTITDESAPVTGSFTVVDPSGGAETRATSARGDIHSSSLPLDRDADGLIDEGAWSWTLTAFDAFGNAATTSGAIDVSFDHCLR